MRIRGLIMTALACILALPWPDAGAQELSLEAAEQLRAQVFAALQPTPAWEGLVRLRADGEPVRVTGEGFRRLRLDEPGENALIHVWYEGWTYVGSENEGHLEPSPDLLHLYQATLLPFLFLDQVAGAPLVGVAMEEERWSFQVQDREFGLLWIDVEGGRPARIRQAADGAVLWEITPHPGDPGALRARLQVPDGPSLDLVLEPLGSGWVSRAQEGPEWLSRKAIEPPAEGFFRPGGLGRFLAALEGYREAAAAGRVSRARAYLREAIRLAPYRTGLYTELGVLELRAGNWQGALAAFDQAFQLDPDDPLLANNLAYLLIDTGLDPHRGVSLARQAVERAPQEPAYLDTLGWGYTRTGRLDEAAEILSRARDLAQDLGPQTQAEIAYHLAVTLARMGRQEDARKLALEVLDLDPGFAAALELLEELEERASGAAGLDS